MRKAIYGLVLVGGLLISAATPATAAFYSCAPFCQTLTQATPPASPPTVNNGGYNVNDGSAFTVYFQVGDTSLFNISITGYEYMSFGVLSPDFFSVQSYDTGLSFYGIATVNPPGGYLTYGPGTYDVYVTLNDAPPAYTGGVQFGPDVPQGPVSVPGPIVGAGLPGLLALAFGFFMWRRSRKSEGLAAVAA